MTIEKARSLLWPEYENASDDEVWSIIQLIKQVCQVVVMEHCKEREEQ